MSNTITGNTFTSEHMESFAKDFVALEAELDDTREQRMRDIVESLGRKDIECLMAILTE